MKILYDYQAFTYQKWGGVSKSFCELICHRPEGTEYQISIVESDNCHLLASHLVEHVDSISRDLASFHKNHSFLGREKIFNLLGETGLLHTAESANKRESIKALKKGGFDVFHPTFFDNYFLSYLDGKPFVLTVHDLMPELFGWYKKDPQIKNKPELCEKAAAIIAVSENTKRDLCRFYHVPEDKIHVVYHGAPSTLSSYGEKMIEDPYFLYVGGRNAYKNWKQTIKDFFIFHKNRPEVKMIFTGGGFNREEQLFLEELNITNSVRALFVTESQMGNLYKNAIAFVFPSLYEGFGMPILEAFANECPVLLNNKSCFPEIGGNAALYFESNSDGCSNLPEIMEEIYSLKAEERRKLIEKGLFRLKHFSWKKSSEMLFDIYKNVM